ncbi:MULTISPECIES: GIY-YIG nuclease family protein [unclassified Campylobacter]|uniref:GIY-YIG nuclease family protein n=1 Tax=unclassified Campylobacter TaxID=2593542 RepID=UPI0022E9D8E5|nr:MULTISPECIES: GIY-YIG nuclease family protein [unclassified Campylobacter]MDA3055190.1 GIY-YIG nuclease family protein [Campylobacter sp. VBCF_07 NA4]MDA3061442.1 GIY-YIG nuclease family protein [Campylobacter sp. VBCF_02 NA5]MDA3070959.1 GIY-YIG nuclease family protein [Campylobacter sp. VBCF_08 NA3]WBR53894.1 GIY-YIG nuclease family protein [Campylobacter sp. VBCF_01 NA2]
MKQYFVYILFNERNGTLYIGVTNDLKRRIYEHKNKIFKGFTEKYGVDKLGYFESCDSVESAILREKQLKGGSRKQKLALIESVNPFWKDLYYEI